MKRTVLIGAACALALAGGVGLVSCSSEPPVMTVTATPEVKADGTTAATIEVKVTSAGTLVDGGELRFSSSLDGSSFSRIDSPGQPPDPSAQVLDGMSLNGGSALVRLYSISKGTATVSVTYKNDELGITGLSKTAMVEFISAGDPPTLKVTVPTDPVKADGLTAATIDVEVTNLGKPIDGGELRLTSSLDGTSFARIEDATQPVDPELRTTEGVPVNSGTASVRLYAVANGRTTVAVKYTNSELGITLDRSAQIDFGLGATVDALKFVSAVPTTIQLKGSGANETSKVTFQAQDRNGSPVRNAQVNFKLSNAPGGAVLDPTSGTTGTDGTVTTTLRSGTSYGTVVVNAALASNPAIEGNSDPISIAGSAPNHKHMSFVCTRFAIGGFAYYNLGMTCIALIADRSGQQVPGVQVQFEAEAGSIPRYGTADGAGKASVTYVTQDPKPVDVAPATQWADLSPRWPPINPNDMPEGNFLWNSSDGAAEPSYACDTGTCNPRDGLVSLIAVTTGEEEWTDTNENGVWDAGEAFVDIPEPFVDVNDNGVYDANDPREKDLYLDANKNGHWDDKNGTWDGSTLIWKTAKLVWTGVPDAGLSGFFNASTKARLSSADKVRVAHCGSSDVLFLTVDRNLNHPAVQPGDQIECSCVSTGGCALPFPNQSASVNHFGKRYYSVMVGDSHTCSPDCKLDDPPCTAEVGVATCGGTFTTAEESSITVGIEQGRLKFNIDMQ